MDKIGLGAVCAAAFFWGTLGIVSKKAFITGMDSLTIILFRSMLAAFLLGIYMLFTDSRRLLIRRPDLGKFLLYGVTSGVLYNFFYFHAIEWTTVTTATILLYTCPAFVIVLAYFFLGESVNRVKLTSLFLTLFGCWLVVKGYQPESLKMNVPGILYGLGAGLSFACLSMMGRLLTKNYHPLTLVFYSCVVGGCFFIFLKPNFLLALAQLDMIQWTSLGYIALFPTLCSNFLFNWGLSRVESGYATIAATSEPVVAMILSFLVLGERLEFLQLVGAAAVVGAVWVISRSKADVDQEMDSDRMEGGLNG